MSTRLIELCFTQEEFEEKYMPLGNAFFVVDPSMIDMNDLRDLHPGKIIRLRRPAWGKGNISDYIQRIEL